MVNKIPVKSFTMWTIILLAFGYFILFFDLHLIDERRDPQIAAIWDALSLYEQDFGGLPLSLIDLKPHLDARGAGQCQIIQLAPRRYSVVVPKRDGTKRRFIVEYNRKESLETSDVRILDNENNS